MQPLSTLVSCMPTWAPTYRSQTGQIGKTAGERSARLSTPMRRVFCCSRVFAGCTGLTRNHSLSRPLSRLMVGLVLQDFSQERLARGTVTSTMRRAAHPSGCARCGAGAGCSAIKCQSLCRTSLRSKTPTATTRQVKAVHCSPATYAVTHPRPRMP